MLGAATTWNDLTRLAEAISARLEVLRDVKLVFVESCTSGLASAAMGAVPGISRFFLGSAVTYRNETKIAWLNVHAECLAKYTSESEQTSAALAQGAMERTLEATLCAAITGHLGPNAPSDKDGLIWIAVAQRLHVARQKSQTSAVEIEVVTGQNQQSMTSCAPDTIQVHRYAPYRLLSMDRQARQFESAQRLLRVVLEYLRAIDD